MGLNSLNGLRTGTRLAIDTSMQTRTEKFKVMFTRYSVWVSPICQKHTLAEIAEQGAHAVSEMENLRKNALQWTGREYNMFASELSNKIKTLRCAWYAKRNGWVK